MNYHPNNEQVAIAYLKTIPYLGSRVASSLPSDAASWVDRGFVTATVIGGSPDINLPVRKPVVSVDCWAVAQNSGKPPWYKAAQLAEEVRLAMLDHEATARRLELPSGYYDARVQNMVVRTEPRRTPGDLASYAHYQMDVEFWWVELPEVLSVLPATLPFVVNG